MDISNYSLKRVLSASMRIENTYSTISPEMELSFQKLKQQTNIKQIKIELPQKG